MIKIPRLRLRIHALLDKAEQMEDLITYESEIPKMAFITDGSEILIITGRSGYLRIPGEQVGRLADELNTIKEDNERFRKR